VQLEVYWYEWRRCPFCTTSGGFTGPKSRLSLHARTAHGKSLAGVPTELAASAAEFNLILGPVIEVIEIERPRGFAGLPPDPEF